MNTTEQDQSAELFFEMLKRGGPGCVMGIVQAFRSQGMGDIASSWMSDAPAPISGPQVEQALGKSQLAGFAAMLKIAPEALPEKLATWLPTAIHRLQGSDASR